MWAAIALHTCVQMEALDRRLSLRQASDSAAALTSAAAPNKSRGRKIAPTLVQLQSNASSFSTFSAQAFAPAQSQLLDEASARDLCTFTEKLGEPPLVQSESKSAILTQCMLR